MDDRNDRKVASIRRGDATPAETDWAAVYDAQQSEGEAPATGALNNQFAKIGCGCALPALFLFGTLGSLASPSSYGASPAESVGELTGTVLGGIALVWVPLFLFWLRGSSKWLIGGTFAVIAAIFVLIGLGKIGGGYATTKKDLGALSTVGFDAEGNPVVPKGMAANGPLSKMMVEIVADQNTMRTAYEADMAKLGIDAMMDAAKVSRNAGLTQNCRRFTDFKAVIDVNRARHMSYTQSVPAKIDALDLPSSTKAEIRKGAMARQEVNLRSVERQWDIQEKSLAPLHRSCLILAKRNWKAEGAVFAFFNTADMNAFNGAMAELKTLDAEIVAINAERQNSLKAGQERIKSLVGPKP